MLEIYIPGRGDLKLENAVFDFNGTLATDGKLDDSVKVKLGQLKEQLLIYILTSDTYCTAAKQCGGLDVQLKTLPGDKACAAKESIVNKIGAECTVCIGNGSNDIGMFGCCALSILVMGDEGCAAGALLKADIVVKSSCDALDLLLNPTRIVATLRL